MKYWIAVIALSLGFRKIAVRLLGETQVRDIEDNGMG